MLSGGMRTEVRVWSSLLTVCVHRHLPGRRRSFTLTFRRGGATDFTRLFFRLARGTLLIICEPLGLVSISTVGELRQDNSTPAPPVNAEPPQDTHDDKKNR